MQYTTTKRDGSGDPITKWRFSGILSEGMENAEKLKSIRTYWFKHSEDMREEQKKCGARRDSEGAKFFKSEMQNAMKMYRASCLLIPYFTTDHGGDCKYQVEWDFPPDLFDSLDYIEAVASL